MKKKGKHFRRRKKGKERSGNILEGETERKGVETFQKEKWKGKERKGNIFTEKKEGKKNKKGRESLRGVSQECGGLWGTLFPIFEGAGLSGYHWWNSLRSLGEWVRSCADIHEVSLSVPS